MKNFTRAEKCRFKNDTLHRQFYPQVLYTLNRNLDAAWYLAPVRILHDQIADQTEEEF